MNIKLNSAVEKLETVEEELKKYIKNNNHYDYAKVAVPHIEIAIDLIKKELKAKFDYDIMGQINEKYK